MVLKTVFRSRWCKLFLTTSLTINNSTVRASLHRHHLLRSSVKKSLSMNEMKILDVSLHFSLFLFLFSPLFSLQSPLKFNKTLFDMQLRLFLHFLLEFPTKDFRARLTSLPHLATKDHTKIGKDRLVTSLPKTCRHPPQRAKRIIHFSPTFTTVDCATFLPPHFPPHLTLPKLALTLKLRCERGERLMSMYR